MEFLWVQWFSQVPGHNFSMKAAQLPKVGFVPEADDLAFGFLDLTLVVCGCHLLPSFSEGQTRELLSAQLPGEISDWLAYYVNMYVFSCYHSSSNLSEILNGFVDCDMFMHYIGGGVGHQDFIEAPRCDKEADGMDTGADNQEVGSDREGTSSDSESDDSNSADSNSDGEDIDPDDEDMGLDIENDYGDF